MVFCQLVLPVFLVVVGLCLLLILPNFNQPELLLSPSHYNPDLSSYYRNFVPFYVAPSVSQFSDRIVGAAAEQQLNVAEQMMERFNGNSEDGVYGVAVPVKSTHIDPSEDIFEGCAQGAAPLFNMSQFMLNTVSSAPHEQGSSRYVASETNLINLIYNAMVNGSGVHAVGIYVNLVQQSFLQVLSKVNTAKITAHNYPLPQTADLEAETASASAFVVALFAMIAFCFIPA